MRRVAYEIFLKIHFLLSIITVAALLVHLLPLGFGKSKFPIASLALWGVNAIFRIGRMIYRNTGRARDRQADQATITPFHQDSGKKIVNALRLTVTLQKPLKICPGQYVYLFFSDMGIRRQFQAHPYVITWWDDSLEATNLTFLIQPQTGISSGLVGKKSIRNIVLDGPYGRNLSLEKFETVALIAKGIGIAGILPYIRHMTYRAASTDPDHEHYRRGLLTRQLDVFWVMEDNCQDDWIKDWAKELQEKDAKKVL